MHRPLAKRGTMRPETRDPRSSATRSAMIDALLALLAARPYREITIQDITDMAGLSRSTFYAHFQGKDDLLRCGFERAIASLADHVDACAADGLQVETAAIFAHAQASFTLYRSLVFVPGLDLLSRSAQAALASKLHGRLLLVPTAAACDLPLVLLAESMAGGLLLLLRWWVDQQQPFTPAQMDEVFQRLVMPGVRSALA
ncbi:TetR/AcrR family transcriptional regulator [Chloroflexia bacterium SDU3-3]|nr:TetR/AcrR family transcriptional regulator [Chloroflexia bacterium SDU3-3]